MRSPKPQKLNPAEFCSDSYSEYGRVLSMGAKFLIGPLAPADRSHLGSHSGNVDGYLRSAVGLGLKDF
jgi:hypothetical protein